MQRKVKRLVPTPASGVDLEEGRSNQDHVAAVVVERAVCCSAQLILVNVKSIGIGLTWTDCSRGSEEAVWVVKGNQGN